MLRHLVTWSAILLAVCCCVVTVRADLSPSSATTTTAGTFVPGQSYKSGPSTSDASYDWADSWIDAASSPMPSGAESSTMVYGVAVSFDAADSGSFQGDQTSGGLLGAAGFSADGTSYTISGTPAAPGGSPSQVNPTVYPHEGGEPGSGPPDPTHVPAPGAVLLGALGLTLVGVFRKRYS